MRLAFRLVLAPLNNQKLTAIAQKLTIAFVKKLKCNLNYSAMFAIQRIIIGIYSNAENYLRCVHEDGSYFAWKEKSKADTVEIRCLLQKWIDGLGKRANDENSKNDCLFVDLYSK